MIEELKVTVSGNILFKIVSRFLFLVLLKISIEDTIVSTHLLYGVPFLSSKIREVELWGGK